MLHSDNSTKSKPAERLANEARMRINEVYRSVDITYRNLMNYQHNNGEGVTSAQYLDAHGKDRKDYEYILRAMKRLLLRINPAAKEELNALVPKAPKTARK